MDVASGDLTDARGGNPGRATLITHQDALVQHPDFLSVAVIGLAGGFPSWPIVF
jgi:hypothetical protein